MATYGLSFYLIFRTRYVGSGYLCIGQPDIESVIWFFSYITFASWMN